MKDQMKRAVAAAPLADLRGLGTPASFLTEFGTILDFLVAIEH